MIAVIFEVQVAEGKTSEYLDIANELRPLLSEIEGFVSIERFQSLSNEGKVLSLSFWRDENAIQEWRRLEGHRLAQSKGRNSVFESYRLRVASVLRDYGMDERSEAPQDSVDVHG
ncbi:antibiotic biosynthesis monooxygenase [Vibrio europaeus]|uniref:Antibiotic biosynthesis monooxygenase n=1 Tax=Vibrio europaeus TaxID=300876 RepID=A0AAE7E009_9VIBR|nr:antibiotic biosynthesis monooxygenase [Vibrio europaeus]MDC5805220.1 antibiotic biosynthesis monooxygenase [Vibrio europaeus]MDC5811475.1 antibiotic biosynthesis monooxygenase [Vibrio europaeus]MDC5826705.1 antibiotic biosynthesis monooxygenase [Vibrio europaeus]MDC5832071.1 antibiotic biosynthesis monooxygenase [Vibrio europaeus]MDC5835026.1 antibiotic biosynthesis monooxygenase [Vibrio europaeus]